MRAPASTVTGPEVRGTSLSQPAERSPHVLRMLRGRTADGEVSPGARLIAALVVLGMLAVAAPAVFVALGWVFSLL